MVISVGLEDTHPRNPLRQPDECSFITRFPFDEQNYLEELLEKGELEEKATF